MELIYSTVLLSRDILIFHPSLQIIMELQDFNNPARRSSIKERYSVLEDATRLKLSTTLHRARLIEYVIMLLRTYSEHAVTTCAVHC